ncbi:MAG: hypothetical protein ACT4PI_00630 [Actinomycetota bacterium]
MQEAPKTREEGNDMWTLLIALGALVWLTTGPVLAWRMGRQGFDPGSWLVLGLVVGPLAIPLALMDTLWWTPPPPLVVRRAQPGAGELDALVVVSPAEEWLARAQQAIDQLGAGLRRLAVVCVLPAAGPQRDQVEVAAALRRDAEILASPTIGLAVLFGRPDDAVRRFAAAEGYEVVVDHSDTPAFGSNLERAGIRGITYRDLERMVFSSPDLVAIA